MAEHGTESGYKAHMAGRTAPCQECKDYRAAAARERRSRLADSYSRERASVRARGRAMSRLAAEYDQRFRALFAEELAKEKGAA